MPHGHSSSDVQGYMFPRFGIFYVSIPKRTSSKLPSCGYSSIKFCQIIFILYIEVFFFFPLLLGINKFIFSSTWKFPLNGIEMCSNNFCFAFYSFLCVKRTFPCQMGCSHKQTEATFAIGLPLPFSPLLLFIFTELSQ